MADATYSADQIEGLLKCSVCLDRYNQPKILPCQHTFCKAPCLQGLISASNSRFIKCPECRAQHLVPREGVDGFATNITISGFLDLQATVSENQVTSAENGSHSTNSTSLRNNKCAVCDAEVELSVCLHCEKRVCDACRESHVRQLRFDLLRVANQLRRKIPQVSELVDQVEQRNQQLRENAEAVKVEINNAIEKHLRELKERQNILNTELDILLQGEIRSSQVLQEDLEVELASIASFCDSTEGAVDQESTVPDTDLIAMRQQSSQLMDQCGSLLRQRLPQSSQFRFHYNELNVTNAIRNLGDVQVSGNGEQRNGNNLAETESIATLRNNRGGSFAFTAQLERGNSDLLMPLTRSPPGVPARRGRSSNGAFLQNRGSRNSNYRGSLYRHQQPVNLRHSLPNTQRDSLPVRNRPPPMPSLIRPDDQLFTTPPRPVREIRDDEERAFAAFISFSNPNFRGNRARARHNVHLNNGRDRREQNQQRGSNQNDRVTRDSVNPVRREGTFTLDEVGENAERLNRPRGTDGSSGRGISSEGEIRNGGNRGVNVDSANEGNEAETNSEATVPDHDYRRKTRVLYHIGSRGSFPGTFLFPRGVAVLPLSENICVVDVGNHRVQIFRSDGQFVRAFGSYGQSQGEFDCPTGVAIADNGNIIISDRYNHRIQIFSPEGSFVREFGSEGSAEGQFSCPWDICCDRNDFIYVCDKGNHRIQKFQTDGTFVRSFGERGTADGQFENLQYIAVKNETLVISDTGNHRIQLLDFDGNHKLTFGSEGSDHGSLKSPKGVAIDRQGFILVANSGNKRVDVFKDDGSYECSIGRSGDAHLLKSLEGIALMTNGNVVVCARENHHLVVY